MWQDFHILGGRIVSYGMDHSLKLWQLDTSEIKDAIEASERPSIKKSVYIQSPYKQIKRALIRSFVYNMSACLFSFLGIFQL